MGNFLTKSNRVVPFQPEREVNEPTLSLRQRLLCLNSRVEPVLQDRAAEQGQANQVVPLPQRQEVAQPPLKLWQRLLCIDNRVAPVLLVAERDPEAHRAPLEAGSAEVGVRADSNQNLVVEDVSELSMREVYGREWNPIVSAPLRSERYKEAQANVGDGEVRRYPKPVAFHIDLNNPLDPFMTVYSFSFYDLPDRLPKKLEQLPSLNRKRVWHR